MLGCTSPSYREFAGIEREIAALFRSSEAVGSVIVNVFDETNLRLICLRPS